MKRRAMFGLVILALSGICFTGCAAPRASGDTESRLQNLENKVASYSDLRARVDALEQAARAKGILEPALTTENLPPLPEQPQAAQGPHSDFAVSSVPGQKEVTSPPIASSGLAANTNAAANGSAGAAMAQPAPETKTPVPVAAKQSAEAAPAPAPVSDKQTTPPPDTTSPFTAKQGTPPQTAPVAAAQTAQAQDATSPFTTKSNPPPVVKTQERQAQGTPPLPQLDSQPEGQAQKQAQVQQAPVQQPQAKAATPPQKQTAPTPAPAPKPTPKTDKGAYEAALAMQEAGKYAESRKAMTAFMEAYPKSAYVPNALYWIGESHYSQSQWDQAILSFKDVAARFPKHAKAADALLKLGMSYEQLKDKDNARFHYEALIEDFPGSRAAGLAKSKLDKL